MPVATRVSTSSTRRDTRHGPFEPAADIELAGIGPDVLIEGFRPGEAEQLGLGPQDCQARNPGLVSGRTTSFGQTGPLANDLDRRATAARFGIRRPIARSSRVLPATQAVRHHPARGRRPLRPRGARHPET
jgi:hypothetical protein